MKLTGRLLTAFGVTAFITALCRQDVCLDIAAVVLAMAGRAVSTGSKRGRIVAALLSIYYALSAVFLLFMAAFSDIGEIASWRLAVVLVMGIWSGTNLLLLICLCDLKSCLPRYSLRTLMLLVLLAAIGMKGLRWVYEASQPPPFASVSAIENRYEAQLTHLRELALEYPWSPGAVAAGNPINQKLFGRKEILEAGITPIANTPGGSSSTLRLTERSNAWSSRWTFNHRKAAVEQPVVTVFNQQGAFGEQRQVAVYANRVIDAKGRQAEYSIEFDLNQLRTTDPTVADGTSAQGR